MLKDVGMTVLKSRKQVQYIYSKTGDEGSIYTARQGMRAVYIQQDSKTGDEGSIYKCKNIFTKMLRDVGMEVPKSIETRSKYTMHAFKGRGR